MVESGPLVLYCLPGLIKQYLCFHCYQDCQLWLYKNLVKDKAQVVIVWFQTLSYGTFRYNCDLVGSYLGRLCMKNYF